MTKNRKRFSSHDDDLRVELATHIGQPSICSVWVNGQMVFHGTSGTDSLKQAVKRVTDMNLCDEADCAYHRGVRDVLAVLRSEL